MDMQKLIRDLDNERMVSLIGGDVIDCALPAAWPDARCAHVHLCAWMCMRMRVHAQ